MKKVLVVDDEAISRKLMQENMKVYFDICRTCENGRVAVDEYEQSLKDKEPYDLICLDIMMPIMDGKAALLHIRALEKKLGIGGSDMVKIVMTTVLDGPKDIMGSFMKGGCDGYLAKPIAVAEIESCLNQIGIYRL